jgi:hypothetical protein
VRRAGLIAGAIAVAYLIVAPVSADLAAQSYRAWLFGHAGPALWDNAWYGGHPLPGYSVLFPPLGALLGVRLAGALSVVAAAVLFAALVRSRAAAAWFAAGIALQLLTGRMAFLLGVALGLGALLAAQRGRRAAGPVLAVLTTLASPVAGAFLAVAGVAWWRRPGLTLAAAAIVPGLCLAVLFPEGGAEPFAAAAFWPALAALLALAVLLTGPLRRGALLAAALCLVAFAVANPLGGNASRLGALFAGPLLLAFGPRRAAALALLPVLAYWQLMPPIRDAAVSTGDPATRASFYAPLLDQLPAGGRLEVPFTRSHWEARWLAAHVPLARGWQRQLDRERNALFYDGTLTAPRYLAWLRENAVARVALPDARLDASAHREAALLRAGVPGLREVWRARHWRLYRVSRATPTGARTLTTDGFTVGGPGLVRVRWSPYWAVVAGRGCVRRAPHGDWTLVTGRARRVAQRFSLGRGVRQATSGRCAPLADIGHSG